MSAGNSTGPYSEPAASDFSEVVGSLLSEFSKLPFDAKVSALFRMELDIVGDVADFVIGAASGVAREFSNAVSNCCRERKPATPSDS